MSSTQGCWSSTTIRMWAKDPDSYSSGVTNAAYVIMKRALRAGGRRG